MVLCWKYEGWREGNGAAEAELMGLVLIWWREMGYLCKMRTRAETSRVHPEMQKAGYY